MTGKESDQIFVRTDHITSNDAFVYDDSFPLRKSMLHFYLIKYMNCFVCVYSSKNIT